MAPLLIGAAQICVPGTVSNLFGNKHDRFRISERSCGGCKQDSRPLGDGSRLLCSNTTIETEFWGQVNLAERTGATFTGSPREQRRRRRLSVSASADQPKPPIFVLKKPQRTVHSGGEDLITRVPLFEDGDAGFGRDPVDAKHKSGYVALIGKPNVGKSTLLNQIIGQKLSIVTNKPQTTRHRILGICSSPDYQMILYDTPGVLPKTMRRLDEMMMQNVRSATVNADCVLVIVDACQAPEQMVEVLEGAKAVTQKVPSLIVLNKVDLIKPGEIKKKLEWYEAHGGVRGVLPVSAKLGIGVGDVKKWAVDKLPRGPAYYPKDIVSEHTERFFVSEIVREKLFKQYRQEIPYASQVNVVNYTERKGPSKDFIEVEIVVEKETQKGILIGKDGAALKLLATAARIAIEDFVGKQVYLELKVKVRERWREDDELLDYYGYNGKIKF